MEIQHLMHIHICRQTQLIFVHRKSLDILSIDITLKTEIAAAIGLSSSGGGHPNNGQSHETTSAYLLKNPSLMS
jgi:hypothetical protein